MKDECAHLHTDLNYHKPRETEKGVWEIRCRDCGATYKGPTARDARRKLMDAAEYKRG